MAAARGAQGTLLSSGTEDYFDSAWCAARAVAALGAAAHWQRRYFNAGGFHLPVAGFTHLNQTAGVSVRMRRLPRRPVR
jgi:hypothetical protein